MSDKTFTFKVPRKVPPPKNLLIRFKVTRTHFVSLNATEDSGVELTGQYALGEGDLALDFLPVAPTCRSVKINVNYEEEPPVSLVGRFEAPSQDLFPNLRKRLEAAKKRIRPTKISIDEEELKDLFTRFDFFKALRSWDKFFAAEVDPKRRLYKAFFHNLDLATNPSLNWAIEIPDRDKECYRKVIEEGAVKVLGKLLGQRVQNANAGGTTLTDISWLSTAAPLVTCKDEEGNRVDEDAAKSVADLMKPAYVDFFKKQNGSLDQKDIAKAFCHFANGDLRTGESFETRMWNCEPDGLQELMFADACIWFIEREIHEDFWKKILPCAAASQKFYLRAYRPSEPSLDIEQWSARNYDEDNTVQGPEFEAMFKAEFERFKEEDVDDISRLIDENLAEVVEGSHAGV